MAESSAPAPDGQAPDRTTPAPAKPKRLPRRPPPKPAAPPAEIPERGPAPDRLVIGRVASAHGIKGAFKMAVLSNHPEHFESLRTVYIGDEPAPRRLRQIRVERGEALVRVDGCDTPQDVAALRGQAVKIAREDAKQLPEGEYYHYQLLGLDVVDENGAELGRLAEIHETGANDVYIVRAPGRELLLPNISSVVLAVDLDAGRMTVRVPEYY